MPHTAPTVIVVEDDADALRALCELVRLWAGNVAGTSRAAEAERMVATDPPDVVLVDLALPDMDGCELIRRMHGCRIDGKPFIIAYTGYAEREERARRAGCDAFVLKPDVWRLEEILRSAGN